VYGKGADWQKSCRVCLRSPRSATAGNSKLQATFIFLLNRTLYHTKQLSEQALCRLCRIRQTESGVYGGRWAQALRKALFRMGFGGVRQNLGSFLKLTRKLSDGPRKDFSKNALFVALAPALSGCDRLKYSGVLISWYYGN
jgi:hypothetical protein